MKTILYNDARLHYAGRWTEYSDSKGSAWQGAQIRFKVSGTLNLTVKAKTTPDLAFAVINVDGGPTRAAFFSAQQNEVVYTLPDAGARTIVLKMVNYPTTQWTGESYCRLMSVSIDDAGSFTAWGGNAPVKLGVVGDSWMGAENDWPYLLGGDSYSVYPTSFGGATASALAAQYDYDSAGILNTSDPTLDAVLINAGVNDFSGGVSIADYKVSMASLVAKVRAKQPLAKIFLLQSPRNNRDSIDYQQYGPTMAEIVSATPGAHYIPTPPDVWSLLSWADIYHLDYVGRKTFAAFVKTQLDPFFEQVYDDLLFLNTTRGLLQVPLVRATPEDALQNPCLRLATGLHHLTGYPVSAPYPVDALLFRTPSGVRRFGL